MSKTIEQHMEERKKGYKNFADYKKSFYDSFGNHITAYEINRFEKYANGEWVQIDTYTTLGRNSFVIDGQIYFRVDNTLIPMNMDFNSPSCGACEQIVREIPVTHKITKNEVVGEFILSTSCKYTGIPSSSKFHLMCQHYSDTKPFYYITNERNTLVGRGNTDKSAFIQGLREYFFDALDFVREIENKIAA